MSSYSAIGDDSLGSTRTGFEIKDIDRQDQAASGKKFEESTGKPILEAIYLDITDQYRRLTGLRRTRVDRLISEP
jgi:hypothetical protein